MFQCIKCLMFWANLNWVGGPLALLADSTFSAIQKLHRIDTEMIQ